MKKRILSYLLAFCLCLALLPGAASASTGGHSQSDAVAWANARINEQWAQDVDGASSVQCVDLIKAYYQYLGQSAVRGNGSDYTSNSLPSGWQRIQSYSGFVPEPGDVVVWDESFCQYGHVAIVISANSSTLTCAETRNIYAYPNNYKCHSWDYSVSRIWGVIRPDFSAATPAAPSVSFGPWSGDNKTTPYVGETDAIIGQTISISSGDPSDSGIYLYDANGNHVATGSNGHLSKWWGYVYFKINEECNYVLTPGTTYKYKFYVVLNGQTYWSDEGSFKTAGTAPVNYAISLNPNSLTLKTGEGASIKVNVSPSGTPVTWSSSNPSVVTVNGGNLTAVGVGSATITATAGGKSASCAVTVSAANVAVVGVTLSQTALSLTSGGSATLSAAVTPSNATNATVTWSSSNPSVATVSNGTVTAVGVGSTTITATAGGKSASCDVTVSTANVAVTGVTLNQSTLSLTSGGSATLTATVSPSNATNATLTWSSSNPSVATVSNGDVTAVGAGNATITATAGDKSASCNVTVAQKTTLQIGTSSLSPASVGTTYSQKLIANSSDSVTWSVSSGSLPAGLTLSSSGTISGTPTSAGTFGFTVTAANSAGSDSKSYTFVVKEATKTAEKVDVHFSRKTVYHQDQFSDVKANQWFTDTVASAVELGLMKGNSSTTFSPYGDVTIAEAITMAARVHSINATGSENFVQTGTWYQVYLDYAFQNGIIDYAYYNSDVTQKATRTQFAEIFAKSLPDENLYAINEIADNAVPDVSMGQSYANSVYKLYRAGILTGSDATGKFNPQTYITRAEAATILSRMAESNNRVEFSLGR